MRDPLATTCPVCDAPRGKRCNAAKGGGVDMATWTHKERRMLVRSSAGGYDCPRCGAPDAALDRRHACEIAPR